MNFAELFSKPNTMPGFWSGIRGTLYRYAHGGTMDQFFAMHWARLRSSWPSYATEATIGELARDRSVLLFDGESRASKEARLRGWRSAHREAGGPVGEIRQGAPLWLPERPTIRVVSGNSSVAMWCTIFGDDEAATLGGATDEELDDSRLRVIEDPDTGKQYEILAGRKPRFTIASTSNWDWDSGYFADPAVSILGYIEPPTIHRWAYIVYKPASITFHGPETEPDPLTSLNSSMLVQDVKNVGGCMEAWRREGSIPWVFVLAGDPSSFEPTGSGAGYPDGSWWREEDRLESAHYELYHSSTEIMAPI